MPTRRSFARLGAVAFFFSFISSAQNDPSTWTRTAERAVRIGAANPIEFGRARVQVRERITVRLPQTHQNVPVLSRGAVVELDRTGRVTRTNARLEEAFPEHARPLVNAKTAAISANRISRAEFDERDMKLAWLTGRGPARLTWIAYRGLLPGTPTAPAVMIDAATGAPVLRTELARRARNAAVYSENPVVTPELEVVTLESLPVDSSVLENPSFVALTCVDTHSLSDGVHMCELQHTAQADANGDFLYTFPGDLTPEDPLGEVSMFHHTTRGYAFLKGLGMPDLAPMTLVSNLRLPQGWASGDASLLGDPNLPLEPFNNSFYNPTNPFGDLFPGVGGGLFFGQGPAADSAYDGDVVVHELSHAAVDATLALVTYWHLDSSGATVAPLALNEAVADYFSSALAGDGQFAEYTVKNAPATWGISGAIRNLDNDDSCPSSISGSVHEDSTFFSGALWSVRQSLRESERPVLDEAVMSALVVGPSGDIGYEDLAQLIVTQAGPELGAALTDEFEKRSVLPGCDRVRSYAGKPLSAAAKDSGHAFETPGRFEVGLQDYAPGVVQVVIDVPEGSTKLELRAQNVPLVPEYGGLIFQPAALVRFANDPIAFTYAEGVPSSNAGDPIAMSSNGANELAVNVDVPPNASRAYVMLVNQGDEAGRYTNLSLEISGSSGPNAGGAGGGAGPSGVGPTVNGNAPKVGDDDSGCGCSTQSRGTAGFAALALACLVLVSRRKAS